MPGFNPDPELPPILSPAGRFKAYTDQHFLALGYHPERHGDYVGYVSNTTGKLYRSARGNYAVWKVTSDQGSGAFADLKENAQVIALVAAVFGAPYLLGDPALAAVPSEAGAGAAAATDAAVASGAGVSTEGAAAAGAGAAAATETTTAATKGAADAAQIGGDAAASTTSDVLGSLKDVASSIKDTVGPIVQSIGETLHDITGAIKDFQEGVIKPILGPITAAMDTFKALQTAVTTDLHDGIKGILRIPGDVANGLGSLDATVQRSLSMLGLNNASALHDVLVPALMGKDGRTLGDLNSTFQSVLAPTTGTFNAPPVFTLEDAEGLAKYKEWAAEQQAQLFNEASLPALIFQWLFKVAGVLEGLVAQREPFVELWKEEIAKAYPVAKLDQGTATELYKRGELSFAAAEEELRVKGYSQSRAAAILSLARSMPNSSQVLSWYARRWIDNQAAESMLKAQGWYPEDLELLLSTSFTELDSGALVELVRRGELKREEAQVALERQGFRQFDANAALAMIDQVLGLADLMQAADRAAVTSSGLGFQALGENAPPELLEQGRKLGITTDSANVLWRNHWRLLSPELAVLAYFREYINRPQLDQVLASASIPAELHENYIDLQRPVIPTRSIGTLMAHGVVTKSEALETLTKRGFTLVDATRLVELYAKANAPTVQAEHAHVSGLNVATILGLFDTDTVTKDEASELLIKLGWSNDAVASTLLLHQVKHQAAERQATIDLVLGRARAGLLDYEGALGELGKLGLTTPELNKALSRLTTQLNQHTKMPSESQVLAMNKHGILTDDETLSALGLLGYGPTWAQRLLELEHAAGTRTTGPKGNA